MAVSPEASARLCSPPAPCPAIVSAFLHPHVSQGHTGHARWGPSSWPSFNLIPSLRAPSPSTVTCGGVGREGRGQFSIWIAGRVCSSSSSSVGFSYLVHFCRTVYWLRIHGVLCVRVCTSYHVSTSNVQKVIPLKIVQVNSLGVAIY